MESIHEWEKPNEAQMQGLRTPNEASFPLKFRIFRIGQTKNRKDNFWGVFGQTKKLNNSTHFGTVSPLSMFSIIQPLFLQKTKTLYPHPKHLFGMGFEFGSQRIRDLAFVCP